MHFGYGMGSSSAVQLGQEPHRASGPDQRSTLGERRDFGLGEKVCGVSGGRCEVIRCGFVGQPKLVCETQAPESQGIESLQRTAGELHYLCAAAAQVREETPGHGQPVNSADEAVSGLLISLDNSKCYTVLFGRCLGHLGGVEGLPQGRSAHGVDFLDAVSRADLGKVLDGVYYPCDTF